MWVHMAMWVLTTTLPILALDNGLGLTPPMGWCVTTV